jgi:hypothetical protein
VRLERWRARRSGDHARGAVAGGAVLRALVVGDESRIGAGLRDAFTRAGVVVLSVSGYVGSSPPRRSAWRAGSSRAASVCFSASMSGASPPRSASRQSRRTPGSPASASRRSRGGDGGALVLLSSSDGGWTSSGRRARRPRAGPRVAGAPLEIAFQLSFVSVLAIACGRAPGARAERALAAGRTRLALRAARHGTLTAFHFTRSRSPACSRIR